MALTINIKGKGSVDKVIDGNSITITFNPDESWLFKYFQIGEEKYADNPYTIIDNGENVVIDSVFYIPIESYLKGLVGFDVPVLALTSILLSRKIDFNSDINDLTQKQLDLLYADLLMWGATNPSSYTGAKESDGGWSQTGESKTITTSDKKRFEEIANDIYIKYGDNKKSTANIRVFSWNGIYK